MTIVGGLGVFGACVAAAGMLTAPINDQRREHNLTISDNLHDLPPEHAVTQAALGVFRGVALAGMWQRMEDLKNEGNYSEAVQLGEWITKLQPKFSRVWEFVSWNQAYNISVGTHTPDERWFWVRSGIDLLQRRGGGVDSNPDSLRLYQQLSWIYHHKLGMFQDQYNWFYKRSYADEFNSILGEPPRQRDDYLAWLNAIAQSPTRPDQLSPDGRRLLAHMDALGHAGPVDKLRAFTVTSVLVEDESATEGGDGVFVEGELVPPAAFPEWASPEARAEVVAYLRRAALTSERLNMDPAAMLRDAEALGAIDWRHPAASAIYWARRGLERADAHDGRNPDGHSNLRRQVMNSLDQLARQGRVVFDPLQRYVNYTPDWPFWLEFDRFFGELVDEEVAARIAAGDDPRRVRAERMERLFGSGYRNRMDSAIADAELYGDRQTSEALLDRMRDRYEGEEVADRYDMTLDAFLEQHFAETLDNPDAARATMSALIVQGLAGVYLLNERDRSGRLFERAADLHRQWRELNPDPNDPLYQEIPDFPALVVEGIGNLLTGKSGQVVTSEVPLELRAGIWASLNQFEQTAIFQSNFGPEMYRQADALGFDPTRVFPPPPNLRPETELEKRVTRDEIIGDEEGVNRATQERR